MKKFLLVLCLQAFISSSNAQSINYNQLQNLYKTWVKGKGVNLNVISNTLKAINQKWKLSSSEPIIDDYVKSYVWKAIGIKADTSAITFSIEEDDKTVKYSLQYVFQSKALYNSILQSLNASEYYKKGHFSSTTDRAKGEYTILSLPEEVGPLSTRIDFLLTKYNINYPDSQFYSVDIFSRYIAK